MYCQFKHCNSNSHILLIFADLRKDENPRPVLLVDLLFPSFQLFSSEKNSCCAVQFQTLACFHLKVLVFVSDVLEFLFGFILMLMVTFSNVLFEFAN